MKDAVKALDFDTSPSIEEAVEAMVSLNNHANRRRSAPIDKPLVLYGAGELGKLARQHLAIAGVPVAGVIDKNAHAYEEDPEWAGYRLLTPEEVDPALKEHAILAVSIVTSRFAPLQAHLFSMGWRHCVPFYDVAETYRDRHPLSNGWHAGPLSSEDMAACEQVLERLADDASRAHYLRFAAWRLSRVEWDYRDAPVSAQDRYFIPQVTSLLGSRERVLDVGAHHGSYLANLSRVKGGFSSGWAIEPDPYNGGILKGWVQRAVGSVCERIECHGCAIGSRSDTARFHAGLGYASQIAPTGRHVVEVETIDGFGVDPTIIKLHIEGGEFEALEGARETIERCRPLIMATIYHNQDGLTRIPLWFLQQIDNYELIVRQHNWCGTGVVAYAIPRKRSLKI